MEFYLAAVGLIITVLLLVASYIDGTQTGSLIASVI
jgi:hypothetical protein